LISEIHTKGEHLLYDLCSLIHFKSMLLFHDEAVLLSETILPCLRLDFFGHDPFGHVPDFLSRSEEYQAAVCYPNG
jgi:hypothetical protein